MDWWRSSLTNFYASPICVEVFNHLLPFSERWRSSLPNLFDIFWRCFLNTSDRIRIPRCFDAFTCVANESITTLQHTCFHFWNVIKTFVETPKITVDVSVNKSKCVKVGNADAVEGATLKQTANFFHLCYKIVKKYKHHYIIF